MTPITADEQDALIEICNVGMSKAAKQLSLLLNSHIDIAIPKISFSSLEDIPNNVLFNQENILAYVVQQLSLNLEGRALLIFHREHASLLTQSVIGNMPKLTEKEIRACEQEAMVEIGNIIISACLSAIANMLSTEIRLSVPSYGEARIQSLIESQVSEVSENSENGNRAIIIATRLNTSKEDISGSLVLILTAASIDNLLRFIQNLLAGHVNHA